MNWGIWVCNEWLHQPSPWPGCVWVKENKDLLVMPAVSIVMRALSAQLTFAIARPGNSAVFILPKSILDHKFRFSLLCFIFYCRYCLGGMRQVINKISWNGFIQSPQVSKHNSSREESLITAVTDLGDTCSPPAVPSTPYSSESGFAVDFSHQKQKQNKTTKQKKKQTWIRLKWRVSLLKCLLPPCWGQGCPDDHPCISLWGACDDTLETENLKHPNSRITPAGC